MRFNRFLSFLTYAILLQGFSGCAPYKMSVAETAECYSENFNEETPACCRQEICRQQAHEHWLYSMVPRHRHQIRWYSIGHWMTWAVLGNDDDGIFGEEPTSNYQTHRPPGVVRAAAWNIRNPLHNFFFYVIGSAHRRNSELTLLGLAKGNSSAMTYKREADTVFLKESGNSLYLGLHGGKPFLSWQLYYGRQCNAYIGWREKGNFGMKFNPCKKVEKEAVCNPSADKECQPLVSEEGWHGAAEEIGDSP